MIRTKVTKLKVNNHLHIFQTVHFDNWQIASKYRIKKETFVAIFVLFFAMFEFTL